jgi:Neurotransmitter-gated ion-channel ligand binding domain
MKNRLIVAVAFLLLSLVVKAQKDTCNVGIYINNIYDFKVDDKSFMADFWIWMNYSSDTLKFENAVEITNSKTAEFSHYTMEKQGGSNWAAQKCRAQLIHQWDVSCFPFDKQAMQIKIEDSQYDTSSLLYRADKTNSKIDASVNSPEWSVESFSISEFIRTYQTTYGNPRLAGKSSYPGILVEITLKRKGSWIKLAKMLTGAYVAFLISCIVFFVSSANQDSRFGLCVGGVFAAIGNKYIVESIVPSSSGNSLMDNVHILTFIFIFLIIILVTVSLRLFESGDDKKVMLSLRLDKWSFYTLVILYILINILLIASAAH